ncbi:fucolectin-7 [Biomphalaria pfeifferi]|uniref:Fucolectin-7 n=1 Tax=Biomphalaria pfeifferi TaxID=112525 RepID=A0AAD8FC01_BIOPF|nr:fucolectin-7 [Biomphalaria pfeifferi]
MAGVIRRIFLTAIFFHIKYFAETAAQLNAALFKPASQSSPSNDSHLVAKFGNDGDKRDNSSRCVQTGFEEKPWWQVDLQKQFIVESIIFTASQTAFNKTISYVIEVHVSPPNAAGPQAPICNTEYNVSNDLNHIKCKDPKKGQFVRFIQLTQGYLQFCELEVIVSGQTSYFKATKSLQVKAILVEVVLSRSLLHCAGQCKNHRALWLCNAFNWLTKSRGCEMLLADPNDLNKTSQPTIADVNFYIENFG